VADEQMLPVWQLSEGELLGGLLASESALRRQYGRTLELIAEAESRGVAVGRGYRDTATLLAMALRISRKDAKARVAQATTPMPLATKALQAGDIGPEHVQEIQKVLTQAPATLPAEDRDQGEETLVELALRADPVAVHKAGRRLLGYWDLERAPKDDEREHAGPYREFRYRFSRDGQMHFTGELDPDTAEQLTGLFQPLAKPTPADHDGLPDPRTMVQRQGDALADIIDLAARADDLPMAGGERAVVTVTVTLAELESRAGAALLDSSGWTSISDLRRWCCDAKVLPAVLGTQGEVLDLGRATRLATPAQRRALALRDGGCSRPGCTRSPRWTHVHHVQHWIDGGPSDMDNMVLLCPAHHRELHHTGWTVRIRNGTPEFTPPEWLDPEQIPVRNTVHTTGPPRSQRATTSTPEPGGTDPPAPQRYCPAPTPPTPPHRTPRTRQPVP
jgi:hypothetical protein